MDKGLSIYHTKAGVKLTKLTLALSTVAGILGTADELERVQNIILLNPAGAVGIVFPSSKASSSSGKTPGPKTDFSKTYILVLKLETFPK